MTHGRPLHPRSLADIRRDLDAGPEWYTLTPASRLLGLHTATFCTYASRGEVLRVRDDLGGKFRFHRDELWRFAQVVHGEQPGDLLNDDKIRDSVLIMLARWDGCASTAQELHDAAHVRPLPPEPENHGDRKPAATEEVTCTQCGNTYFRPIGSGARWSMCRRCSGAVRQRATRTAREFVAWCRCSQP